MQPQVLFGLTSLGVFHTIISFIALYAGAKALIRDKKITWENPIGKLYIIMTILVCLTGFGIFQHGGFGKPHQLGIITLVVIAVAFAAGRKTRLFGNASPYIETVAYSLTFFFHLIPTYSEALTRLPYGAPIASSPDDPRIKMLIGITFLLFLIGVTLHIRRMRKGTPTMPA